MVSFGGFLGKDKTMKKILVMGIAAVAAMTMTEAQALTLKEASAKVAEAAETPATMADVMKQLSKEDQIKFLASVNEAIEAMPVPAADKVAMAVQANQAAIKAAPAANRADLMAEMFATASLESLAVINENFSAVLFDPAKPLSAEAKADVATQIMKAIENRTAQSDVSDADKRNAAAVLMFTRADASLKDTLLAGKEDAEKTSKWVDAAVNLNNYKWLTGSSDAAALKPSVLPSAPDALSGALLADLAAPADQTAFTDALLDATQYALPDQAMDFGLNRIPRTMNKENKWYNGYQRGDKVSDHGWREPQPYFGQGTF